MPKPVLILVLGFLVYLVTLDPTTAGNHANTFLGWVGDVVGGVVDFVDGAVSDDQAPSSTLPPAAG